VGLHHGHLHTFVDSPALPALRERLGIPNTRIQDRLGDLRERLPVDEVHRCPAAASPGEAALYGPAITAIVRSGARWYAVAEEEYATPILFCPWCRIELRTSGGERPS
jgi:hypothetical protein